MCSCLNAYLSGPKTGNKSRPMPSGLGRDMQSPPPKTVCWKSANTSPNIPCHKQRGSHIDYSLWAWLCWAAHRACIVNRAIVTEAYCPAQRSIPLTKNPFKKSFQDSAKRPAPETPVPPTSHTRASYNSHPCLQQPQATTPPTYLPCPPSDGEGASASSRRILRCFSTRWETGPCRSSPP